MKLCKESEIALIRRRLLTISELETGDWPYWVKMISGIYQLTAGDFRVYFGLFERKIVISHVCRKVGQTAKKKDLDRASINFQNYKNL